MAQRLGWGAIRVLTLVVVLFLAIVYLKLGYFIIFLLPLGALLTVLVTRKQRAGYPVIISSLVAIVAYAAATALVWSSAIQRRDEVRELRWAALEQPSQREPEVRLILGGSHFLFSHSSELRSYLESRSSETITVSLPVTRILGCFQSVGPPRIEGWGVAPLGGYGAGTGVGPWEEYWWCP